MEKKDCFAYARARCKILNERKCEGCSFYKAKEQFINDRQQALDRIHSLDEATKRYIINTYYCDKK